MTNPHFASAKSAAGLLFLSGQVAFDSAGRLTAETIEAQTTQCLVNIEEVLRQHGLGRRAVVKTTVWLRTTSDFVSFNNAYATFFGDHKPARSTVRADLMIAGALVEIEAVATSTLL